MDLGRHLLGLRARSRRIKALFLLGGACVLLTSGFYQNVDIPIETPSGKAITVRMSREDAKRLEDFFREVMLQEPLAYTLAGEKPISFAGYRRIGSSISSFAPSNLKVIRGWKTWKKYCHQFSNEKVKFWEEDSPWVKGVVFLVLADVERCREVIQQHETDFLAVLESSKDPLTEIGKGSFFQDTLQKHDALIGILLGFGRENAWLYHEKKKNSELPSLSFIWGFEEDRDRFQLPRFVGNPDSKESKQLKKKYLATQKRIKEFYEGRDFLAASLSLYTYGQVVLAK